MSGPFVLTECRFVTGSPSARNAAELEVIDNATVAIIDGRIAWYGPISELPETWGDLPRQKCEGGLLTAGLVDPFVETLPSDACSELQLAALLKARSELTSLGVVTSELRVEHRSDVAQTLSTLRALKAARSRHPLRLTLTLYIEPFSEDDDDHEERLQSVCNELLPAAHLEHLVDAVEVACEEEHDASGRPLGFSLDDASSILEAAYRKKIPTRLSCERYSDTGGVALAPSFYARSAAYLNHTDELGVEALAQAATVALLVPNQLSEDDQAPPVEILRRVGVPLAVGTAGLGTDLSFTSPLVAAASALQRFGLQQSEAWLAITQHAASVLFGSNEGTHLRAGALANLALWDATSIGDLLESAATVRPTRVWIAGKSVIG